MKSTVKKMDTRRLFVAIDLPDPVKDALARLQTGVDGATWVKRPTLHLTLRFLGDRVPAAQLEPIKRALAAIEQPAFDIRLHGVGRFPPSEKKGARVLWAGVAPQPALTKLLQPSVERAVTGVGLPPDGKPFNGHITLARLKQPDKGAADVSRWLAAHQDFATGSIPVTQFILYASLLTPQGPRYTHEGVFPLM